MFLDVWDSEPQIINMMRGGAPTTTTIATALNLHVHKTVRPPTAAARPGPDVGVVGKPRRQVQLVRLALVQTPAAAAHGAGAAIAGGVPERPCVPLVRSRLLKHARHRLEGGGVGKSGNVEAEVLATERAGGAP